jgi:hypothetical protein
VILRLERIAGNQSALIGLRLIPLLLPILEKRFLKGAVTDTFIQSQKHRRTIEGRNADPIILESVAGNRAQAAAIAGIEAESYNFPSLRTAVLTKTQFERPNTWRRIGSARWSSLAPSMVMSMV